MSLDKLLALLAESKRRACRTAPLHVCRKRPFATQADRLRPRLKGGWLQSAVIH